MTIAEIKQAIFEQLAIMEDRFAIRHSMGATLYLNPSNGFGDKVAPRHKDGRKVEKLSSGLYRPAADEFNP